jgi:hypothetical protein
MALLHRTRAVRNIADIEQTILREMGKVDIADRRIED